MWCTQQLRRRCSLVIDSYRRRIESLQFDCAEQGGNFVTDDWQQHSRVDSEILMRHHISKSGKAFPIHIGIAGSGFFRDRFCCFTELRQGILYRSKAHTVGMGEGMEGSRLHISNEVAEVDGGLADVLQPLFQRSRH